eukprot:GHVS01095049.1.p1 GENE.GHVS01095049.1~~GHVS01095049.1.p1  ORF type:complete len:346 (+),score=46.86 GHVS01095049.1:235-1272(+)
MASIAKLSCILLLVPLVLLVCVVRSHPVKDVDMLPKPAGAMRGFTSGLAVLKGYLLSVGHVFPSLPYYSYPWATSDIDAFLNSYYGDLDAGSTQAIEDRFEDNALLLLDVRSDSGIVNDSITKGKSLIVKNAKQWIENRGALTVPTVWNVLSYRHPILLVEGDVTFATNGAASFVQSFVFRGDKVGITGQVVKTGTAPSAVVPTALTELLDCLYEELDNKQTAVAQSNFPNDYTSILFHHYPEDDSTFHLFSKDLKGYVRLSETYFHARGPEPTKTTWTVVKYLFPKIWVEVTVEQPVASGTTLSTALVGYKLDEDQGKFQLLGDLSVLEFPNTTVMEFFFSLNK